MLIIDNKGYETANTLNYHTMSPTLHSRPCKASKSLIFQLWNRAHPFCQPPINSNCGFSLFQKKPASVIATSPVVIDVSTGLLPSELFTYTIQHSKNTPVDSHLKSVSLLFILFKRWNCLLLNQNSHLYFQYSTRCCETKTHLKHLKSSHPHQKMKR